MKTYNTRVYYEDTDCGGVVYHTNYIKFCERARSEIFFDANMIMDDENGYFLVKSLKADFIKPAMLSDELEIITEVLKLKKVSIILNQSIYKNNQKIFELEVTIVYMQKGKMQEIPKEKLVFFR